MANIILSNHDVAAVKQAVIAGLDVASGARSKATYYHSADEQQVAVRSQVEKLYNVSKELPLILGAQDGATGFFIQEALLNEFKQTVRRGRNKIVNPQSWDDERLRDRAVEACLNNLAENAGVPYVLRMFVSFKERKINNARARRFALRWILGSPNLEFWAVKYREKLRTILTHLWGVRRTSILVSIIDKNARLDIMTSKERELEKKYLLDYTDSDHIPVEMIVLFIFGKNVVGWDGFKIINQFYRAKEDVFGNPNIPEEVLVGLLSNPEHPQHQSHWSTKEAQAATLQAIRNTTRAETANVAVRKTKQEQRKGIVREESRVAEATDPIALLKTVIETGATSDEITERLHDLAKKAAYKDFPYEKIGVVLDSSPSMSGHASESKHTPTAISQFTSFVLRESAEATLRFADGNLAHAFLSAVGDGRQAVFILSDGYENQYEGLLNEVVTAYKKLSGIDLPVYHVAPLGAAETNARPRSFGDNIISLNATYKTLPIAMQAQLLQADVRAWLANQVQLLESRNGG